MDTRKLAVTPTPARLKKKNLEQSNSREFINAGLFHRTNHHWQHRLMEQSNSRRFIHVGLFHRTNQLLAVNVWIVPPNQLQSLAIKH
jgi:hypothetical protein